MGGTLDDVARRWRQYEATAVSQEIAQCDAMFDGSNVDHYLNVGRSAIEIIALSMIRSGKSHIASVFDMPCGAGRVTRHLRAFFPEADIFVSDLDKQSERFASETFAAHAIDTSPDFSAALGRTFDLIFCGSLLTHFPKRLFLQTLEWLCHTMGPDGLLVLTLHGRRADYVETNLNRFVKPRLWQRAARAARRRGFGYIETVQLGGMSHGVSLTMPSWIAGIVERHPSLRIVSYSEAAWDDHQDALVLQNMPVAGPYAP
jgi:SAM-dependent methyltransferase